MKELSQNEGRGAAERKKKREGRIKKNVVLLGGTSLLTDLSSEMIHPLLPMFISALGGGGLVVGLIGGLGDGIANILKIFAGFWADRRGKRKPFIFSGYLLSSICKLLLAFSTIWQHILVLRPMERSGKGLRTAPRDAIIAESSLKWRGRSFGLHRAMDTMGAIGGSSLAFLLFYLAGWRFKSIFLLAGFVGFSALIPLFWVKEKKGAPKDLSLRISLQGISPPLRWFIFAATLFSLGNFTYMFFLLKVRELVLDPRLSIALPVLFYVWFNVIYSILSFPLGMVSDKIGRVPVLISGYSIFGLVCLGFVWCRSLMSLVLLFGLYGFTFAAIEGQERALVSDMSAGEVRATVLGTFHTSVGLATLPASLIAGFLWQYFRPELAFVYGAAMGGLSTLLLLFFAFKYGYSSAGQIQREDDKE
ncbi:MFS transporter [Candidatus Aerophobetes bacterium]|uniref:MFS transporter n=1 Tax=Aerophobetes bacterium TaxID=2030807 RepID=A0A523ULB3_UNCAE|nr:MAG: MFS transporter [Candidatus Aerophobetes bacterium]